MFIFSGDWLYIWGHRGGNSHKALATKAHSKITTLDLVEWKLKPKVKAIHCLLFHRPWGSSQVYGSLATSLRLLSGHCTLLDFINQFHSNNMYHSRTQFTSLQCSDSNQKLGTQCPWSIDCSPQPEVYSLSVNRRSHHNCPFWQYGFFTEIHESSASTNGLYSEYPRTCKFHFLCN